MGGLLINGSCGNTASRPVLGVRNGADKMVPFTKLKKKPHQRVTMKASAESKYTRALGRFKYNTGTSYNNHINGRPKAT